ncbi:MAG: MFS transporter [Calditrichaeota bacterium]|nr:MFS transporter [Calditrichota bacterium]MCB9391739.1 MFS transporter [Calditrichota bacterium]
MFGLFKFRRGNAGQVWAWATYDFGNSAFATTILAVIFNKYYAGVIAGGAAGVEVFGTRVPGTTVFSFFVSASMVLIAILGPLLSALSDLGKLKLRMLALHAGVGIAATAMLATLHEGAWLIGGLWFLVAQFGFAGGNIFYNAMLMDIADERDYAKVSAIGWAWGYLGGGLLLALNLVMLQYPHLLGAAKGAFTVQHCFLSAAIWWAVFTIPVVLSYRSPRGNLRPRVAEAYRSLKKSLRGLRQLPTFSRFFLAYLLYNDGIETVIVMASIFGDQELHMATGDLVLFFLMVQGVAFVGSLIFGVIADRLDNRRAVLIGVAVWCVVALWGWQLGWLGNAQKEYWFLGILAGIVMGGTQAASRSLQAVLIPPANSAEFFSFFAISGKFASAIGPAIFGIAVWMTGSLRLGMLSLLIFFIAGAYLLWTVSEERGRAEALAFQAAVDSE